MPRTISRRHLLAGFSLFGVSALSACTTISDTPNLAAQFPPPPAVPPAPEPVVTAPAGFDYAASYAEVEDEGYQLPAIPFEKVDHRFLRQIVDDQTGEQPGTIIVNTAERLLYLVLSDGKAMRYGVGLGRQGYSWKGRAVVQWKRKWPTWTPPDAMIRRDPKLEKWRNGMPPGVHNPLGSRALYIFKDGQDTLYRIHGSPEWTSIGKAASSGCVRMFNQDVMDLYQRVPGKAPLLVL